MKALVLAVIAALLIVFVIVAYNQQNNCKCINYSYYEEVTLRPDNSLEHHKDSVCTGWGYDNGTIIVRAFQ